MAMSLLTRTQFPFLLSSHVPMVNWEGAIWPHVVSEIGIPCVWTDQNQLAAVRRKAQGRGVCKVGKQLC